MNDNGRLVLESAADYICDLFGLPTAGIRLSPVARGLTGRIWKLTTNSDDAYALKELFWDDVVTEASAIRDVNFAHAARRAGVRCPVGLPAHDGTYLHRLPPELGGVLIRLFTWADGTPIGRPGPEAARWLGVTLARLHALAFPATGAPDDWFETAPGTHQWQELLENLREQEIGWAGRLADLMPTIEDLAGMVTPTDPDELLICHLDVTPDNVLALGPEFVLLDWENTASAAPARELAATLMSWHVHSGHPDPGGIGTTIAAYRESGGPASITGLPSFAMYVATTLNHMYTQASVAVAEHLPVEHRELAHTKVATAFSEFPSRTLLEEMVHLAGAK